MCRGLPILLSVLIFVYVLHVKAGLALTVYEGSGHIYPSLKRTDQVNLWYSVAPTDYGMDCSLYTTGQYGVLIFFRGLVVAEAFVSSCDATELPMTFTVQPHHWRKHRILVRFADTDTLYVFKHPNKSAKKDCIKKYYDQHKYRELYRVCVNGWCNLDDVVKDYIDICIQ